MAALDEQTRRTLLEILELGLSNIRSHAWAGDCAQAANEADHIHNIPGVLRRDSVGGLHYYLTVEKELYLRKTSGASPSPFDDLWSRLRDPD